MRKIHMAAMTVGVLMFGMSGMVEATTDLPVLTPGWNLVGLMETADQPAMNASELGDVSSVWKWTTVNGTKTWAVYLPGEYNQGDYAASKGFGQLDTIAPGEGFWVNVPATTTTATMLPITTTTTLAAPITTTIATTTTTSEGTTTTTLAPTTSTTEASSTTTTSVLSTTTSTVTTTNTTTTDITDIPVTSTTAETSSSTTTTMPMGTTYLLPDTGQTQSFTNTYGEDSDYTINPPSLTANGNGTVTDNVTGLVWQQQDDSVSRTWDSAISYCANLSLVGNGWRLPSKKELLSIVDYGNLPLSIDPIFTNTTPTCYWTSTTLASNPGNAWGIVFYHGNVDGYVKSIGDFYARCVRGGL